MKKLLILVLFILCLIMVLKLLNKEHFKQDKKILMILFGGSFRTNNLDDQKRAWESHLKFVNYMEEKFNIKTHIIITTYPNKNLNMVEEIFKEKLLKIFQGNLNENRNLRGLFENIFEYVDSIKNNYDFIINIRNDAILKKYFLKKIKTDYDKIIFLNWQWREANDNSKFLYKKYTINHSISIIPSKYYNYLKEYFISISDLTLAKTEKEKNEVGKYSSMKVYFGHFAILRLLDITNLKICDFDTMLNTIHWANTSGGWNPIYYFYNRKHSKEITLPNYIYKNNNNDIELCKNCKPVNYDVNHSDYDDL